MSAPAFVHLRLHSEFSIVDGTVRIDDAIGAAVVRDSSMICLYINGGSGHRVTNSELANCGKQGFFLQGVSNTLFQSDTIHGHNAAGTFDPGLDGAGGKLISSSGVTFRGNTSYSNNGPGLWADGGDSNLTFDSNVTYDNTRSGIFVELGSGATITNNKVWRNGWGYPAWGWGAGILAASSANVTISDNIVAWNADGIGVISQDRGNATWNNVVNMQVRGNTIVMAPRSGDNSAAGLAWLQDWSGVLFNSGSSNGGSSNRFWWSTPEPRYSSYGWNGWLSTLAAFGTTPGGQGATALSTADMNTALAAAGVPTSP